MSGTEIVRELAKGEYQRLLNHHKNHIGISPHALKHIYRRERKIQLSEELLQLIIRQTPTTFGLQENTRYVAFFRKRSGFLRIIFENTDSKLEIVTFMNVDTLPNFDEIENAETYAQSEDAAVKR